MGRYGMQGVTAYQTLADKVIVPFNVSKHLIALSISFNGGNLEEKIVNSIKKTQTNV